MIDMNVIRNTNMQLQGVLTAYQNASAEAIHNHFNKHNRAVLADEVGLGKTFVAKRVIALEALRYYLDQPVPSRPFRVGYICPNLQVAEQNFEKLSIFPVDDSWKERIRACYVAFFKAIEDSALLDKTKERYKSDNAFVRIKEWAEDGAPRGEYADLYRSDFKITGFDQSSIKDAKYKLLNMLLVNFGIEERDVDDKDDHHINKKFYRLNKIVHRILTVGDVHEDQRLSMQHLYSYEAQKAAKDRIMQLESLTPSTSFDQGNTDGTYQERMLIAATLDALNIKFNGRGFIGKANKEKCKEAYDEYRERLEGYKADEFKPNVSSIPELRKYFAKYNADHLEYDLVIMDEFQNFRKLMDNNTDCGKIVNTLFGKNCRILILSATPFSVSDTVSEDLIDEGEATDFVTVEDAENEFFELMKFLGANKDFSGRWKQANEQQKTDMLYSHGIFRTERAAAVKEGCEPVNTRYEKNIDPDFRSVITSNLVGTLLPSRNSNNNTHPYRTDYGVDTPFPLTFSAGYSFETTTGELTSKQLSGEADILGLSKRFVCLEERLLGSGSDIVRYSSMLWIPPCGCELKGQFTGLEGFSKSLIFTQYRMTPRAFTYLLNAKVARIVGTPVEESINDDDIGNVIQGIMPAMDNYPKTRKSLQDFCKSLFKENVNAVRILYPEDKYTVAVEKYCLDLCFSEMITEYVNMLEEEYSKKDADMNNAVKKLRDFKQNECTLYLNNGEETVAPAGLYAAGLYSDTPAAAASRMRKIKPAFNSPFRPFVFTTTSIGAEGIDLHWYARHVIHWSVPAKATDLEQRIGRVLRRNCHAVRLNRAKYPELKDVDCITGSWIGSGMFDSQLNFTKEEGFRVTSETFFEEGSRESFLFDKALDIIKRNRSVLNGDLAPFVRNK